MLALMTFSNNLSLQNLTFVKVITHMRRTFYSELVEQKDLTKFITDLNSIDCLFV